MPNVYDRATAVLNAVEETLDELRDRDDPSLEQHIATLEEMQADLLVRLTAGAPAQ
jgi:hypothetical protein